MGQSQQIGKLLSQIESNDPKARDLAAAEITDLLEANHFGEKEYFQVVETLMKTALHEKDPVVRESMFNALSEASAHKWSRKIAWSPIASIMESLDEGCLEHALVILGFSKNKNYKSLIEKYLAHADEAIRVAAADALAMLTASRKRLQKRLS